MVRPPVGFLPVPLGWIVSPVASPFPFKGGPAAGVLFDGSYFLVVVVVDVGESLADCCDFV